LINVAGRGLAIPDLEALLIMRVEKQLLDEVQISNINDDLKANSTVMSKIFPLQKKKNSFDFY